MRSVNRILAATTSVWSDDVGAVGSTPVECRRTRETVKRCDLAGRADYGYCASYSRYFWACACTWWASFRACPSPSS
ncbi:hypothetical protein OG806_48025 [Streptomyces sp. NBC_00882]|uniref:hypothetical protein n=1 Tax=Streptomyces TaxID=1883 RepID=UPI00386675E2|nr:hypothetical protein OH837_01285 [Streptomyces canus]WSZ36616.1 hypothetical protein OG806_48025 [Streptomyces sp. NBC_00882]WSZ63538.1 hypothetical protein OH824_46865 [Streptomyces canus]